MKHRSNGPVRLSGALIRALVVVCILVGVTAQPLAAKVAGAALPPHFEAPTQVPGTGWSLQKTPNPPGSPDSEMFGVSCVNPDYCISVGYSEHLEDLVPLAELWNGTTWRAIKPPNPPDSPITFLYAVSCSASNDCVAVGQYDSDASGVPDTLIELWNGRSWQIQASPDRANGIGDYLYGVSCTASDACMAIGYTITPTQQIVPLALAWDGTSWTIQAPPRPAVGTTKFSPTTYLYGVSCTGADDCMAVGYYQAKTGYNEPITEAWNGTTWTIENAPIPSGVNYGNHLYGVSCTLPTSCTAVGYTDGGGTLVEAWNGAAWSMMPSANPTGNAVGNYLYGVSCSAADDCTAIGFSEVGNGNPPLAESWDGASWSIQPMSYPTGTSYGSFLYGVSCSTDADCIAVGNHYLNQSPIYTRTYQFAG